MNRPFTKQSNKALETLNLTADSGPQSDAGADADAAACLRTIAETTAEKTVSTLAETDSKRSETVIKLRPDRIVQSRLLQIKHFSRRKRIVFYASLLLLTYFTCPAAYLAGHGVDSSWGIPFVLAGFIFGWTYLSAMLFAKQNSFSPNVIRMNDEGFRLKWKYKWLRLTSPIVRWQHISYVGVSKYTGLFFRDNLLVIHVSTKNISADEMGFFAWFYKDFWGVEERCRMYIDPHGIASGADAKEFLRALTRNLPQERIDPVLIELLSPTQSESYTELWLSSLDPAPDRLRNDALQGDTVLCGGRYTIIDEIGSGGQGVAYRARMSKVTQDDGSSDQIVVLKEFILPAHGGPTVKQRSLDSIEREANLLKQIAHPQIVRFLDFFVEDERAYLVLQHIEGQSLRRLVERDGRLPETTVIKITSQLCDILHHLHSQSPPVVHRDFTPENVMIGPDGAAKLIDFNVAQQLQSTATKTVVGKHCYIPPEQFRGKATPQSDIYALGATIYFMLTGEDPEPISSSHPKQMNPAVTDTLDALVARATATETSERFADIQSLRTELHS